MSSGLEVVESEDIQNVESRDDFRKGGADCPISGDFNGRNVDVVEAEILLVNGIECMLLNLPFMDNVWSDTKSA